MSPVNPSKYDAFISYAGADRPWAKQLADGLTNRNVSVFYDRKNFDVGNPSEEQLDDSLNLSQQLIMLWSENAGRSGTSSTSGTTSTSRPASRARTRTSRRAQTVVLLDEPVPKVHDTLQMIPDLKGGQRLQEGAEALDLNARNQVGRRIDDTTRGKPGALRVLYAVLAADKEAIKALDFAKKYLHIWRLNSVLPRRGSSLRTGCSSCTTAGRGRQQGGDRLGADRRQLLVGRPQGREA